MYIQQSLPDQTKKFLTIIHFKGHDQITLFAAAAIGPALARNGDGVTVSTAGGNVNMQNKIVVGQRQNFDLAPRRGLSARHGARDVQRRR